jgi:hypothetical protein
LAHCANKDGRFASDKLAVTDEIREWVRRNWFDVVASGEAKHYKAGTWVDQLHSRQGTFSYASKKYVAKKLQVEKLNLKSGRYSGGVQSARQ